MNIKVISKIFLVLTCAGSIGIAGDFKMKPGREIPAEAKALHTYIQELQRESNGRAELLPKTQIRHYAKLLFEATELDPMNTDSLISCRGCSRTDSVMHIRFFEGGLLQTLHDSLDVRTANFAQLPIFIAGTVLKKTSRTFAEGQMRIERVDFMVRVERVYKGKTLAPGDTIVPYMVPGSGSPSDYEEGRTYIFPLGVLPDGAVPIAMSDQGRGDMHHSVIVKDNEVLDLSNAFGCGIRPTPEEFERKLLEQFQTIKSW